ncbi:MAG: septal ring lytic transglycosylase RlpA family protein [Candidatus Caenarcaniphilales bacterium]|nr:septal ring lytic transglycosylase RlpA family protein [Candidatus Caenarcaniphilales bacterium]
MSLCWDAIMNMKKKNQTANTLFITLTLLFTLFFGVHQVLSQTSNYGKASWIGERFQGKKTSSGELFDMNDLTASHATLPFGSKVKVTSQKTGKSVTVRINNRSELNNGRIIDLSKRAADEIGLIEEGVGYVTLNVLSKGSEAIASTQETPKVNSQTKLTKKASDTNISSQSKAANGFVIQYGSFFDIDNSIEFRDALKKKNIETVISFAQSPTGKKVYRINSVKQFTSRIEARHELASVAPQEGIIVPVGLAYEPGVKGITNAASNNAALKSGSVIKSSNSETLSPPTANISANKDSSSLSLPEESSKIYEYGVQFGAFSTLNNAQRMQKSLLTKSGIRTIIHQFPDDERNLYRVLTNHAFSLENEARDFLNKNKIEGMILTFVK